MMTTNQLYMATLAAMGLAAMFLLSNIVIAGGRVLRGRDRPLDLPIRLASVAVALAIALAAWPHARTAMLNTIGQDAGAVVATVNSLAEIDIPAIDLSGNSLPNVSTEGASLMDLFAPDTPSSWGGSAQTQNAPANPTPVTWSNGLGTDAAGNVIQGPAAPPTWEDVAKEWGARFAQPVPTPVTIIQYPTAVPVVQTAPTSVPVVHVVPTPVTWRNNLGTDAQGNAIQGPAPLTWGDVARDLSTKLEAAPVPTAALVQAPSAPPAAWGNGLGSDASGTAIQGPAAPPAHGGGPVNPPVQPVAIQHVPTTLYVVGRGDTMFKLAKAFYGDGNRWRDICAANQPRNCDLLVAGQTLTIP